MIGFSTLSLGALRADVRNDAEPSRHRRRSRVAIAPMFWGKRIALNDACEAIRAWIAAEIEAQR